MRKQDRNETDFMYKKTNGTDQQSSLYHDVYNIMQGNYNGSHTVILFTCDVQYVYIRVAS
jgi:hypothetical protein